ncbi:MAG: TraR/DksA C4-type zinc finger protein [bacterium]|nr:TraR/DksA C4-type zinc finger protein [bacterium]
MKSKIQADLEALRSDIAGLEESTQPIAPDVSLGRLTRMDAIQNKSVNEAALSESLVKLEKLKSALTKLDETNFGVCESCGEAIAPARLEYMPETTTCVNCA